MPLNERRNVLNVILVSPAKIVPSRVMEITRPLFDSSGVASAFGSFTSTPPCMMGAVIMKITIRSIITSISETTLISALSGARSPRERRRMLDLSFARHQCDHLGSEAVEFAVEAVEVRREDVIPEHRGDGDGEGDGGGRQGFRDPGRHGAEVAGAALGDAQEGGDDAEHRAEQPHQRAGGADDREDGNRTSELVALRIRFGVEHEAEGLDLRPAERGTDIDALDRRRPRVLEEPDRPGKNARVRARLDAFREREGLIESWGLLELLQKVVAGLIDAPELEPLRENDAPAHEREAGEQHEHALRDVAGALDELDRCAWNRGTGLWRKHHAQGGLRDAEY